MAKYARDEYGDIPGHGGNQYATMDTVLPEANPHVGGTITRTRGGRQVTEFWMTAKRPPGYTREEWDAITTARWEGRWLPNDPNAIRKRRALACGNGTEPAQEEADGEDIVQPAEADVAH